MGKRGATVRAGVSLIVIIGKPPGSGLAASAASAKPAAASAVPASHAAADNMTTTATRHRPEVHRGEEGLGGSAPTPRYVGGPS